MDDSTRCFVLNDHDYEEISYVELQERRTNDPGYADKRFISLHGMLMEVTEAGYRNFYRDLRRQRYLDEEATRNGAFSYNALDSEEMSGEDTIADTAPSVDEIVSDKLLMEAMRFGWSRLNRQEQDLLTALFFDGKSERELSRETGIPQKTINDRRHRALTKLRKFLEI